MQKRAKIKKKKKRNEEIIKYSFILESFLALSLTSKEENPAAVTFKELQMHLGLFLSNLISKEHVSPVHHVLTQRISSGCK